MVGMPLVAFIDLIGDGLQLAAMLVMVGFGFRHGFFLALLSTLVVMTAAMAGVALAPGLASHLELLGLPARVTLPVAYFALTSLVIILGRLAVGAAIADDDVRFRPTVERAGGVLLGAFAGMLLGGTMLVGWSMCEVPGSMRSESPAMTMDSGARLIWTAVRLMDSSDASRRLLLEGNPWSRGGAGKEIRASEPFADTNEDWKRSSDEPFLDFDGNSAFTLDQLVADLPEGEPGIRDSSLLERYWLSCWRRLRVLHRPQITSPPVAKATGWTEPGTIVYQARATDVDAQDKVVFQLKAGEDDEEPLLRVDPETGEVRFREQTIDQTLESIAFTVIATDRSELTDEQKVLVNLEPSPGTPASP